MNSKHWPRASARFCQPANELNQSPYRRKTGIRMPPLSATGAKRQKNVSYHDELEFLHRNGNLNSKGSPH